MRSPRVLVPIVLLAAGISRAEPADINTYTGPGFKEEEITQGLKACEESSLANQIEIGNCSSLRMYRAERNLDKTYKELLAALNKWGVSEEGAHLQLTQMAWLVFRDLDCKQFDSGTAVSAYWGGCITHHAEEREAALRLRIEDRQ